MCNQLSYKTFEKTLNKTVKKKSVLNYQKQNHQIYSINQTKYALSSYNNKRYWHSDFERLPFGHTATQYLRNEKMI